MDCVATLTNKDKNNIVKKLRLEHPLYSGIPTFEICDMVAQMDKNTLCYLRGDRPCMTLCHVCLDILNKINKQYRNIKC